MLKYFAVILGILFCILPASGLIYIAQNDPLSISVPDTGGTCWYFPTSEQTTLANLYDVPVLDYANSSQCRLTAKQTANMNAGTYDFVYTYPAQINGRWIKDVGWKNQTLVSIFAQTYPKDEHGKQARGVESDLESMIQIAGVDGIYKDQIKVEAPYFTVQQIYQIADNTLKVSGTSNLADGTLVHVFVDQTAHYAEHDTGCFTFDTTIHRDTLNEQGSWSVNMILPLQEMAPGNHELSAYAGGLKTVTSGFPISSWWTSLPTPVQYINYFWNGSAEPVTVVVTVPVPAVTYIDRWNTATPTPAITDALGEPVSYPYTPGKSVAVPIGIIALLGIVAIVIVRDYRRK